MTASISKLLPSWLFIDLSEHHYTALTSKFNDFLNRSSTMLNNVFKCLVDVIRRLHIVMYSLLGWTTRGRHHTPVSVCLTVWPLHRDFSLLFARSEVGSFTCIGCDSPIHRTDGLESPPKDLAMRIKRLAKGRYCRGGIWTHAEPPVWKFAVYTLALRPLGHDSSSFIHSHSQTKWNTTLLQLEDTYWSNKI